MIPDPEDVPPAGTGPDGREPADAARDQTGPYDAGYYGANRQAGDRPALRWYTRLVRRYCGPGPYLDFGCGTGFLLRRLAACGPAAGFEVSSWAAAAARVTAPGAVVYERLADLPARAFGAVVAVHVVEHLDDDALATAFDAWRRVLVPGGRALIATPDPAGRGHAIAERDWIGYADPTHVNLKPHARWRELLGEHGFVVVREGSDGLWNVRYGRMSWPVDAVRAAPAFAQFVAGRLVLPRGTGESSVFVVERSGTDGA